MKQPEIIEHFVLLDVDRTILNSTTFVEDYVYGTLRSHYIAAVPDVTEDAAQRVIDSVSQEERANRGKAFDYLAVYGEFMVARGAVLPTYQTIAREILTNNRGEDGRIRQEFIQRILVPGTLELIQAIDASAPWGFLTTGGQQTQRLKLEILAAILEQECRVRSLGLVLSSEQKAHMVETVWYDETLAAYHIPRDLSPQPLAAQRITLIDDKPKNLMHTASTITTHLVHAAELDPQPADEGHGPRRTLAEIQALL